MNTSSLLKIRLNPVVCVLAGLSGLFHEPAKADCTTSPDGLIAWWPGDGNALDETGNHNGTLMSGTDFAPGVVNEAFNFDGISNYVEVPTSDSLNPTATQGWTVEGWVRPVTNGFMVVVHKGDELGTTDPYDYGRQYWGVFIRGDINATAMPVDFEIGQTGDDVYAMLSTAGIPVGQWSHIAIATTNLSGPTAAYQFYINGTNAGTTPLVEGTPGSVTTTDPLRIGVGIGYTDEFVGFFTGQIDELSIYDRALSADEIAAIYSAGSAGKCKPGVTVAPLTQQGYLGGNAMFSAIVTNAALPVSFQWYFNTNAIAGATNCALSLTNLQFTNTGLYYVVASPATGNPLTSIPSSLTVSVAGVNIALYAGVTITGVVGNTYGIQSTTTIGDTNSWVGRTNVTLSTPSFLWYDSSPATFPETFYRVELGPISIP